jgi:dephospho-CoA kinase
MLRSYSHSGLTQMRHIVAVVGLAGSGKSELTHMFEAKGYARIRFGDITEAEMRRRGLGGGEANERTVREDLRRRHGMAAYAVLSLPKISRALKSNDVVIDGLYSWEEYLCLRARFGRRLIVVALHVSPGTRYARLGRREVRPLTPAQAESRDHAEIEKINKGGPIAMADLVIVNESNMAALHAGFLGTLRKVRRLASATVKGRAKRP